MVERKGVEKLEIFVLYYRTTEDKVCCEQDILPIQPIPTESH